MLSRCAPGRGGVCTLVVLLWLAGVVASLPPAGATALGGPRPSVAHQVDRQGLRELALREQGLRELALRELGSHEQGSASGVRTLLVEPEDGLGRIYRSIVDAKRSIDLEMYELVDPKAESLLAQAAARGVRVRVILDRRLEGSRNAAAFAFLSSHRVKVAWAPPGFHADHEKALVVDTHEAWIMTLNLTAEYYANTRDFAVLDTSPEDVRAIVATFDADFAHRAIVPSDGADLVWSPTNASSALLSVIAGARSSLWVESEELSSASDVGALVAAARRAVAVHVIMNDTKQYAPAFDELVEAGAKVGTYPGDPGLYVHAKAIVRDPGTPNEEAFVGSENLSSASLFFNRELGVVTTNPIVVDELAAVLERDAAGSAVWRATARTPSAPAPGAATCSATAVPANDGYPGDYDVDVDSNQPYTWATASDPGDTWSDETNGSGYVRIVLYHTSPGVTISVTVGPARCSTRAR